MKFYAFIKILSKYSYENVLLLKALYLDTFEITKKWTLPIRNGGKVYGKMYIMYEEYYKYIKS